MLLSETERSSGSGMMYLEDGLERVCPNVATLSLLLHE